jgi:hypothetical protein
MFGALGACAAADVTRMEDFTGNTTAEGPLFCHLAMAWWLR